IVTSFSPNGSSTFIWQNGRRIDLGTLDATAINNAGQVVGNALSGLNTHGFLWQNGQSTDLGTLGGRTSFVYGLNNAGQAVGNSPLSNGEVHAFLWRDGHMTDLNDLLPAGFGWELISAMAINDLGQIGVQGLDGAGHIHAFLLSPEVIFTPE